MESQEKEQAAGQEGNTRLAPLSSEAAAKILEALAILAEQAFRVNEDRGWHEPPPTDAEATLTIHEEATELGRYFREGRPEQGSQKIPKFLGVEEEGADILLRLVSWYRRRGWRLGEAVLEKMEYNKTRPRRHGGKAF